MTTAKTPDQIRAYFELWADVVKNNKAIEPVSLDDCIWMLLEDVIDSIRLAEGGSVYNAGPVQSTVQDYLCNAYGRN
jgi:hypothetical protein